MAFVSDARLQQSAQQLASIIGAEKVHAQDDGSLVITPASTEQVAEVLSFAKRDRLTVSPQGGATKQSWGRGESVDLRLSLERLNRLVEHPWQDLTCTVQAGCLWSTMQQQLATHGQFVALDPIFPEHATVGGVLAANDSGALRHRYGSLRDLVIGMTLVLADGTIARTGGKVVKNVAGYDLCKLMTGSLGTLAIITEANFRLYSVPLHSRNFTISAKDAASLSSLLVELRASHLMIQALQLRTNTSGVLLDVQLNAHPEARQDEALIQMVRRENLALDESSEEIWRAREVLFANGATILRISTLPTQVCPFLDSLRLASAEIETRAVSQSFGLHTVSLRGDTSAVNATIKKIREDGATVTVLQQNHDGDTAAFEIPASVLSLMRAVKDQFDPDGILSPGKFFR
jgi:glycolate oxidase FAD binding subunit